MHNDVHVRNMDMGILGDEVVSEDGSKELRWCDGVLLGKDISRLFLRISSHDHRVVGAGVAVV